MPSKARELLRERARELQQYLALQFWLRDIAKPPSELREGVKAAHAGGYLLIYNMVEATLTEVVDELMQQLSSSGDGFDDLSDALRQDVFKRLFAWVRQGTGIDTAVERLQAPLAINLVNFHYKRDRQFSGNVDLQIIREVAQRFGLPLSPRHANHHKNGTALVRVKKRRQELAHGALSFAASFSDDSLEEVRRYARRAVVALNHTVRAAEKGAETKSWRRAAATTTTPLIPSAPPTVPPAAAPRFQSSAPAS